MMTTETADRTSLRSLYSGTVASLVVQVVGAGLSFATQLILARLLGSSGYGTYALALTWGSILCNIALCGQNTAVLRFMPRYMCERRWGELRGLRVGVMSFVFVTSCLIAAVATIVTMFDAALSGPLRRTLMFAFVLLTPLALLQMSGALHRGLKRAASSSAYFGILRPASLAAFVVIWWRWEGQASPEQAMAAGIAAGMLALACSEWSLHRVWPAAARRASLRFETRRWLGLGRQLFFMSIIGVLLGRVDVLILGGFVSAKEIGSFFAAVQLGSVASYGLLAANTIMAPLIAEHYGVGDTEGLRRLTRRSAQMTFAITIFVVLPISFSGHFLLALFGKGFEVAYVPLLILLAGQCINALCGPVGNLMTMTCFEHRAPIIFGGAAFLNVVLNLLLAPHYGMVGAAIATAISTATWNLAALAYVLKRLGINPTVFSVGNIGLASSHPSDTHGGW